MRAISPERGVRGTPSGVAPPRPGAASRWLPVAALVAVSVAAAVAYALLTPSGYGPDEPSHWSYVQTVAHGALPGADVAERQQPPLFYLLGALAVRAGATLTATRFISAALGGLTVLLAALAARELWPDAPGRWAAVAALPALLPEIQWLDGTVSNDALSFAAGAALILVTVMTFTRPPSARLLALAGAVAGAALLSKETDYGLVLVLAVCVAIRWRAALRSAAGAAALAIPLVVAGWWFARNLATFGRPLPPLRPLLPAGEAPRYLRSVALVREWIATSVVNLVGNFVTLDAVRGGAAATWRAALHAADVAVAAAVIAAAAAGLAVSRPWGPRPRGVVIALAAGVAVSAVLMVVNSVVLDYQPQGRYLLVAAPAAAILAVAGYAGLLSSLSARRRQGLAGGAVAALLALDVVGFETLRELAARLS